MKKTLLFIALFLQMALFAQTAQTIEKPLKLTNVVKGVASDSILVRGADKIVKHLPVSQLKTITNLDYLATPTGGTVFSSAGNDAVLPLATATNAGLQSPNDKSKLDGIATGATANQTDAYLLARTNHTGEQLISTVTGLQTALDTKVDKVAGERLINAAEIINLSNQSGTNTGDETAATIKTKLGITTLSGSNTGDQDLSGLVVKNASITAATNTKITYDSKGLVTGGTNAGIADIIGLQSALDNKINTTSINANNGVAPLDAGGKVPFANLPASLMIYKGMWNPATNSPTLANGTGTAGWVYKASSDGTVNLGSGSISFLVGDFVIHNGTAWERSAGTDNVVSVNNQQGVVTLTTANISDSADKRYQTDAQKLYNDATSSIQTQLNGKQPAGSYEPAFAKNMAFNKNFGTAAGTVAEGNDSRINNGQTAFGWGNHGGLYPSLTGSGASGWWNINSATTSKVLIEDTRVSQKTPEAYTPYMVSADFTDKIAGLTDWKSVLTLKGWQSTGYAAWQLIGPSGNIEENWYLRSGMNTTWNPVRKILHDGNFNDYSPALTGAGASGTWGINISGKAGDTQQWRGYENDWNSTIHSDNPDYLLTAKGAMVSKNTVGSIQSWLGLGSNAYTSTPYVTQMDGARNNTDYNTRLTSGFYNTADLAINRPSGSEYSQLIVAKGVDTGFQIAGGYWSDNLWFRGWSDNGASFSPWRTVIHNANYNSFSPTLTGTNATGTWPISITGLSSLASQLNVYAGNEATIANGFSGGEIYVNYRGSSGAITNYRFANGLSTGAYTNVTAASFVTAGGTSSQYVKGDGSLSSTVPDARPYKVYTVLMDHNTGGFFQTILENTLGGGITWIRTGVGLFEGTFPATYTATKVACFVSQTMWDGQLNYYTDGVKIFLQTRNNNHNLDDYKLGKTPLEIRVYN